LEKYNEIIGLNDYFQAAYDLTNEIGDYWKQFIPNSKFFEAIRGVLNSLESEKKSLWLQGTYGTGKSHATAVIKHLLFEDTDQIKEFIENFQDIQIKTKLLSFRKKNRVFPVVLKGLSNVIDNRTFALVIEKAVKEALKKYGISISTKSDFEKMIYQIETNPGHIDWDSVIQKYSDIRMYVKGKDDLLRKLKTEDLEILKSLESLSSAIGIHFSQSRIDEWLAEVINELKSQNQADSLMVYWDEFTSVLQHPNTPILLTELQHISELSKNKDVYLFVVSHKTPSAVMQVSKDDMEKTRGRFQMLDYSMERITTYHIMGAAIKKKNLKIWTELSDEKSAVTDQLIRRFVGTDGEPAHYKLLKDLFPIHPYTAYLCTFIASYIGSTERSIFNFLYDKENGFNRFICENPSGNSGVFLTADYLWDFFMNEFERIEPERFSSILDKYKLHRQSVEECNPAFSVIFKGILLLNAQYKMVSVSETKEESLVSPSLSNIKAMFYGTEYEADTDNALSFFDERQILSKNPDNLFLISSSSLPFKEIEKEKEALKSTLTQIGTILSSNIKEIQSIFISNILRKTKLKIFDAFLNQHLLKSKLKPPSRPELQDGYSLHIALLIARNVQEREEIKKTVRSISAESEFSDIIFIIPDDLFDEAVFNKFLEYRACANVAIRHNFKEDQDSYQNYAKKVLDNWVQGLKNGYAEWHLSQLTGKTLISNFSEIVNADLSARIFYFGLETLKEAKKNTNVWTEKMAKVSAENFLFPDTRSEIDKKTETYPARSTREILKNNIGQYIVDEYLRFQDGADPNHPLVKMSSEVEKKIEKQKNAGVFHVGNELKFLTKPPFGLYKNMICLSAIGFLMKKYVGKLYESGTGKPIEKEMMRDNILDLFKYWETGNESSKLEVRLGTAEEKELIHELSDIFSIKDIESLSDIRWKIRNWTKDSQYPLWVFKWSENLGEDIKTGIDKIIELTESMERDITHTDIKNILYAVSLVRIDLSLLFKTSKSRPLFIIWLQQIDNVEIKEQDIEDVIRYVRQNMPEEIGVESWKENRVREKVKDWYIELKRRIKKTESEKLSSQPTQLLTQATTQAKIVEIPYTPPADGKKENGKVAEKPEESKLSIIMKIERSDENTLKSNLKRMIEECPDVIGILEEYL